MIEEGALEDPKVDAIIGMHNGGIFNEVAKGEVGIRIGPTMACLDSFDIEVIGDGGHGAMPNQTIDPVVVSADIIQGLQTLISREISPVKPGVISICKINGGTAYNIIPDSVKLEGTARFIHEKERAEISQRIGEISKKIADSKKASIKFNYNYGYPPLYNPKCFANFLREIALEIVGSNNIVDLEEPTMGGEDMSYFMNEIPGIYFFLGGIKKHRDGKIYPHHNSKFDLDENVFWIGTAILSEASFRWLKSN